MTLTILLENTSNDPKLKTEHGLSLYIEACGHKILFDAGQSSAFASNAAQLGIDLSAVDLAILSHGHYDHGGGLLTFLEHNEHAPIYVSRSAFEEFYNGRGQYIGLPAQLQSSNRLRYTNGTQYLCDGLTLTDGSDKTDQEPFNSYGLTRVVHGHQVPDTFLHEQYLLIGENGKRILVTGCSHKGILNLMSWFKPDILVGGFHLKSESDPHRLQRAAQQLMQYDTIYYTGHCTGEEQYAVLKQTMQNRLTAIRTGMRIDL